VGSPDAAESATGGARETVDTVDAAVDRGGVAALVACSVTAAVDDGIAPELAAVRRRVSVCWYFTFIAIMNWSMLSS
jgi:hypothetical protein